MAEAHGNPAKLWGGRFSAEPTAEMDRLNRSLPVDRRLWREDLEGSQAWAAALGAAGVLSAEEAEQLRAGLDAVGQRLARFGVSDWDVPDEDIHSLIERLLREAVGPVAGKLHTGRSRNDQVATDTRLWGLRAIDEIEVLLIRLQTALVEQAEQNTDTVIPSYTHLQRAQPISAAHWLLSHAWALARDRQRLAGARVRTSVLPLGSGAIAGCPFPVNRERLRQDLRFATLSDNSVDAVGDRDWMAELLFVAATIGVHLSRLGEDLILFSSAEFAFVRLADAYSTGSSLMPQKRNPDAMELARGKAARLIGDLTAILTLLKGLPSGYNKDLQEDKEVLFDAVDTLASLLPAVTGTVSTMQFDRERCRQAVDPPMLATDLADFLVRRGVPFREAHEMVGRLVKAAEGRGSALSELPKDTFAEVSSHFASADMADLFDPRTSIDSRDNYGGTGSTSVRGQIDRLRQSLQREP
jgi:argininosuccinate lyase